MKREEYIGLFEKIAGQVYDLMFAQPDTPTQVPVYIKRLENHCGVKETYQFEGDSGFDLRADGDYTVAPGGTIIVKTGIAVAVPIGTELQVRTRSGSPVKKGFFVANSPGTVDAGYRGEVGVIIHNFSDDFIEIEKGERIAQGVLCPVYRCQFIESDDLGMTDRGEGGYNSTGTK